MKKTRLLFLSGILLLLCFAEVASLPVALQSEPITTPIPNGKQPPDVGYGITFSSGQEDHPHQNIPGVPPRSQNNRYVEEDEPWFDFLDLDQGSNPILPAAGQISVDEAEGDKDFRPLFNPGCFPCGFEDADASLFRTGGTIPPHISNALNGGNPESDESPNVIVVSGCPGCEILGEPEDEPPTNTLAVRPSVVPEPASYLLLCAGLLVLLVQHALTLWRARSTQETA